MLNIIPREHFWVSGIRRSFNLSILLPLYHYIEKNIKTVETCVSKETTVGDTTVVYSVNKDRDTIYLITGWKGARNSTKKKFNN